MSIVACVLTLIHAHVSLKLTFGLLCSESPKGANDASTFQRKVSTSTVPPSSSISEGSCWCILLLLFFVCLFLCFFLVGV